MSLARIWDRRVAELACARHLDERVRQGARPAARHRGSRARRCLRGPWCGHRVRGARACRAGGFRARGRYLARHGGLPGRAGRAGRTAQRQDRRWRTCGPSSCRRPASIWSCPVTRCTTCRDKDKRSAGRRGGAVATSRGPHRGRRHDVRPRRDPARPGDTPRKRRRRSPSGGQPGGGAIAKNLARYGLGVGHEHPATPQFWQLALRDAGFTDVRFEPVVAEAGIVSGTRPR